MTDHNQDSDCTVVDDTCTGCGVVHGLPCEACGGTGFHKDTCARVEVRLAEEALANAREALAAVRRVSAFRAKVCADLRTAARLAREAMCAMLEARDDSFDLIPERDKRPADEGVTFFEDDDRSKLWNDLLVAAENIEDAEDAALALAEHIEKNGANLWPLEDAHAMDGSGLTKRDGFYDDELVLRDAPAADASESARLLAEKEAAYAAFMAAIDASNAAQNHVMHARDAYLAAAERADKMR